MQQRATHLHLGHHQPQVLHGAHTAGAAVADKASRLVVLLVEDKSIAFFWAQLMPWLYSGVTTTLPSNESIFAAQVLVCCLEYCPLDD